MILLLMRGQPPEAPLTARVRKSVGVPMVLALGSYTVTARVSDGRGGATSCSADIKVEPRPNRPPTMSCSVDPSSVRPGGRVRVTATASDPDNDPLTYAWQSNGGQVSGSGAEVQVDTTGLTAGSYAVTGRVDDGRGGAADCRAQFSVEAASAASRSRSQAGHPQHLFPDGPAFPWKANSGLGRESTKDTHFAGQRLQGISRTQARCSSCS